MNEIRESLTRIETKVDVLIDGSKDREKRIRDLEKHRNWLAGAIATLGALWALMWDYLSHPSGHLGGNR